MQQALVTRLMERQPSTTGSFPGQADTRTGATDGNGQSGDKWVWKVPMASACPCLHLRRVLKQERGRSLLWLWLPVPREENLAEQAHQGNGKNE